MFAVIWFISAYNRVDTLVIMAHQLERISDYMAVNYPDDKPVRKALLGGQHLTRTFRERVQQAIGGKIHASFFRTTSVVS